MASCTGSGGIVAKERPLSPSACPAITAAARSRAMDLSNFLKMDPHLLVGLLNTELRNHCDSLTELVKTHHLDPELVIGKMAAAGYVYQPEQNQFR
jgi:N12 class adenine-specific DNA methylase